MLLNARDTDQGPPLEVSARSVGHRTVLQISGEIDLASAQELSREASSALSNGAMELWLDLTAVSFIDVAGVRALLALRTLATTDGRHLAVIAPAGPVRRVMDLTGATARLPLFADRFEAHRLG